MESCQIQDSIAIEKKGSQMNLPQHVRAKSFEKYLTKGDGDTTYSKIPPITEEKDTSLKEL